MILKTTSAASGTVHSNINHGIPHAHLISSHTAYTIYLSNSLSFFLILLASLPLSDLHDFGLESPYSAVNLANFHVVEQPPDLSESS